METPVRIDGEAVRTVIRLGSISCEEAKAVRLQSRENCTFQAWSSVSSLSLASSASHYNCALLHTSLSRQQERLETTGTPRYVACQNMGGLGTEEGHIDRGNVRMFTVNKG